MTDPLVLVLGSINMDLVIHAGRLPRAGETVAGGSFYQAGGGKGANQAIAAARASQQAVGFIGAVGNDDFGRRSLKELRRDGVLTEHIRMIDGQPTGVALITVDDAGENQIVVAPGANASVTPDDVAAVDDAWFSRAKVFLASLESPRDAVLAGLKRAREAGLTTILNPAPATEDLRDSELLTLADVLTPNESEATLISGWDTMEDLEDVCIWCEQLQRRGSRQVIITRGAKGAIIKADSGDPCLSSAYSVSAVDATGAGDCFNGVLASSLAAGETLLYAARYAMAAAAVSVTRRGAIPSLPTRDEIDSFLAGDPERSFPAF